jgi:peptidoglycan/LPS O-acetylase OafA/YrhL
MEPQPIATDVATAKRSRFSFGMPVQTTGVSEPTADGLTEQGGQRLSYVPGLDGIRAISIIGIMANHSGMGWAAGGFISVNVFFVLSGYLITALLVKEWAKSRTISLRRFWARRARRLLPALLVLLVGIALYAWLIAPPDTRGSLRTNSFATLFYFANWHQIFAGQSYFAQTAVQSPLLHTWTLAIEEQFYLVWPLVVLGMLKWWRRLGPLLVLAVVGAVASAAEMFLLYHPGMDPSRLYYGTDTRAQDLLLGAIVAIVLAHRRPATTPGGRRAYSVLVMVAAAGFAVEWVRLNESSAFPYRGGFLLADLLVGLVILGVVQAPERLLARALGWRPLTYIGQVSYGLYLWHWPVILVVNESRTGLTGWPLFLLRSIISFGFAVASAKLVEIPIRRGAIRSWKAWVLTPVAAGAAAAVLLLATTAPAAVAIPVNSATGLTHTQHQQLLAANAFTTNPVRFMLFGDSIGLTTAIGLSYQAQQIWGVSLEDETTLGCSLDARRPIKSNGTVGTEPTTCADWQTNFAKAVNQDRPQVVGVMLGRWETLDTEYQGQWTHIGEPLWDNHLIAQLDQAIGIFTAHGAKVVLFTMPYINPPEAPDGTTYPENQPSRVDAYNSLLRRVAARYPTLVSINDVNKELDPQGHFTATINGVTVRWSDGIHVTIDGGIFLRSRILPQIGAEGLGRATG